jgi:hypothetical protein
MPDIITNNYTNSEPAAMDKSKNSLSIMGGDEPNTSMVDKALKNKQWLYGIGLVTSVVVFIVLAVYLTRSESEFAPIRIIEPNPTMSVRKERYLDKLPKNRKNGLNERNISRFLNTPSEREYDRVTMDNGQTVSSDSSLNYDITAGNVEQSVIDAHREWADNSVVASAGANSKLMVNDHKNSINTRVGMWGFMTRAQDVYTDEGARVVNSEYPDQIDDSYGNTLARSISNRISGSSNSLLNSE